MLAKSIPVTATTPNIGRSCNIELLRCLNCCTVILRAFLFDNRGPLLNMQQPSTGRLCDTACAHASPCVSQPGQAGSRWISTTVALPHQLPYISGTGATKKLYLGCAQHDGLKTCQPRIWAFRTRDLNEARVTPNTHLGEVFARLP